MNKALDQNLKVLDEFFQECKGEKWCEAYNPSLHLNKFFRSKKINYKEKIKNSYNFSTVYILKLISKQMDLVHKSILSFLHNLDDLYISLFEVLDSLLNKINTSKIINNFLILISSNFIFWILKYTLNSNRFF